MRVTPGHFNVRVTERGLNHKFSGSQIEKVGSRRMTQIVKTKIFDARLVERGSPGLFEVAEPLAGFLVKEKIL